jgi:hypothetical protein
MSLNWKGLITQDSCDTGKLTWNTEPDPARFPLGSCPRESPQ